MKKYALLTALLCLVGCAEFHTPQMATPPKNPAKFAADSDQCKAEAHQRFSAAQERNKGVGPLLGAMGGLFANPSHESDPDFYKNIMDLQDDCMIKRGYPIVR